MRNPASDASLAKLEADASEAGYQAGLEGLADRFSAVAQARLALLSEQAIRMPRGPSDEELCRRMARAERALSPPPDGRAYEWSWGLRAATASAGAIALAACIDSGWPDRSAFAILGLVLGAGLPDLAVQAQRLFTHFEMGRSRRSLEAREGTRRIREDFTKTRLVLLQAVYFHCRERALAAAVGGMEHADPTANDRRDGQCRPASRTFASQGGC